MAIRKILLLTCITSVYRVTCFNDCKSGTYGAHCELQCGHCEGGHLFCEGSTGYCLNGCAAGYRGRKCHDECEVGTYGRHCSQTCDGCVNRECHPETGQCSEQGCRPGRYGDDCSLSEPEPVPDPGDDAEQEEEEYQARFKRQASEDKDDEKKDDRMLNLLCSEMQEKLSEIKKKISEPVPIPLFPLIAIVAVVVSIGLTLIVWDEVVRYRQNKYTKNWEKKYLFSRHTE